MSCSRFVVAELAKSFGSGLGSGGRIFESLDNFRFGKAQSVLAMS